MSDGTEGQPVQVDAQLLAIVAVQEAARVRCQHDGCTRPVYAAVHVVREAGRILVLGSTCYGRRYGSVDALGLPSLTGGGAGRPLTDAERELLAHNTAALIARFEEEAQAKADALAAAAAAAAAARATAMRPLPRWMAAPSLIQHPPVAGPATHRPAGWPAGSMPWPWQKPRSSVAFYGLRDGTGWLRVTHRQEWAFIVPMPTFDGWDEAIPSAIGSVHPDIEAIVLNDWERGVAYLRSLAAYESRPGVLADVAAEVAKSKWQATVAGKGT